MFEECAGGELYYPISNPKFVFTEHQAAVIMRNLLLAVKSIHDSGFVHRDLKPENILLVEHGVESAIKLIDFGLATALKPNEKLTKRVGTPYYIAPEVRPLFIFSPLFLYSFAGFRRCTVFISFQVLNKMYGMECDMWSVGVILFTLACGYLPVRTYHCSHFYMIRPQDKRKRLFI